MLFRSVGATGRRSKPAVSGFCGSVVATAAIGVYRRFSPLCFEPDGLRPDCFAPAAGLA